jgi:hypothetical protein
LSSQHADAGGWFAIFIFTNPLFRLSALRYFITAHAPKIFAALTEPFAKAMRSAHDKCD